MPLEGWPSATPLHWKKGTATLFVGHDTRISFPVGVSFDPEMKTIVDSASEATLTFNDSAGEILGQISEHRPSITVGELAQDLSTRHGLRVDEATADVVSLLLELNKLHILNLNYGRSFHSFSTVIEAIKLAFSGVWPTFRSVRYAPSSLALATAVATGFLPLIVASAAVASLFLVAFFAATSGFSAKSASTFLLPTALLIAFGITGIMHEGAHLVVAKLHNVSPAYIVRYFGSTFSVIKESTSANNRIIALSGPLSGIVTAVLLAEAINYMTIMAGAYQPVNHVLLLTLALPHIWALTPLSRDGAYIWRRA